MRRLPRRDFDVYEFKEEDEEVESASGRFVSRIGKHGRWREDQAVSRFSFLKSISQDMFDDQTSLAGEINESFIRMEASCPATPNPADASSDCSLSDKLSNETHRCTESDDENSWMSSPEDIEKGSLHCPVSSNHWNGTTEDEDVDIPVIILAEYVICGTKLFSECQLTFFPDRIKIQCSEICGKEFSTECEITEIDRISCQWSQSVGTTWVKIWLKSNPSCETVLDACRSSVLKFSVLDFDWFDKERKIMILAPRYKTIWSTTPEVKSSDEEEEAKSFRLNISRYHLPDFMGPCDEVIYPKGDPDAVSISKRDVDLLQPETFINDTIIDFYIKYLINKLPPKERPRFHFFNSFFFRKLVDLDKDPLSTAEGRTAFLRVRKWTRKVNIFEKDYLFIPVNYNLHWSLLVICHPGEVSFLKEDSVREACKVPCVLHMDSMKGNHDGLKKLIQSYLWEEWKERHLTSNEDTSKSSIFSSLRFIPLELPQQQNAFDCGFFLLHYVELFLKEAPANFNPFTITKFSNFLNEDWFVPEEASRKRFIVRNLIYELFRGGSKEESHPSPSSSCHSPQEEQVPREQVQEEEEGMEMEALAVEPPLEGEAKLASWVVADSLESDDDDGENEEERDSVRDDAELHTHKRCRAVLEDDP
ncbi:putative ubiquitin-like-specific protease 2B [Wolffia australiana]